ncbi:MAG: hypothetical protein Q7T03_06120 [Deltaproteobacteria bacterium]|nr:hypothetical protein [Deltaproteobacteria bacterium]
MISAGYIGGGKGELTVGGGTIGVPMDSVKPQGELDIPGLFGQQNKHELGMQDNQFKHDETMQTTGFAWGAITNGIQQMGQIVGSWINYLAQSRWMEAQETINDRKALASETIAGYGLEGQKAYIEYAKGADERRNGPDGSVVQTEQIHADAAVRINKDTEAAKTERAALATVDQAFGRSDYGYGDPEMFDV